VRLARRHLGHDVWGLHRSVDIIARGGGVVHGRVVAAPVIRPHTLSLFVTTPNERMLQRTIVTTCTVNECTVAYFQAHMLRA
jgi:hypothetical protein